MRIEKIRNTIVLRTSIVDMGVKWSEEWRQHNCAVRPNSWSLDIDVTRLWDLPTTQGKFHFILFQTCTRTQSQSYFWSASRSSRSRWASRCRRSTGASPALSRTPPMETPTTVRASQPSRCGSYGRRGLPWTRERRGLRACIWGVFSFTKAFDGRKMVGQ